MTLEQIIAATVVWGILLAIVYHHSGFAKIRDCYMMWSKKEYWTDYNTVIE